MFGYIFAKNLFYPCIYFFQMNLGVRTGVISSRFCANRPLSIYYIISKFSLIMTLREHERIEYTRSRSWIYLGLGIQFPLSVSSTASLKAKARLRAAFRDWESRAPPPSRTRESGENWAHAKLKNSLFSATLWLVRREASWVLNKAFWGMFHLI